MSAASESIDRLKRLALGWAEYRRRQWIAGLMWLGFLPLTALIVFSVGSLTRSEVAVSVLVSMLAILALGAGWRFVLFRCPNCNHYFHLASPARMTNGRICPHCGLERYQID
jgi:predicted RNA-binding Zn-ribbon protein involved in translation (DUF1610 family)